MESTAQFLETHPLITLGFIFAIRVGVEFMIAPDTGYPGENNIKVCELWEL